jgi:hypothetical protein
LAKPDEAHGSKRLEHQGNGSSTSERDEQGANEASSRRDSQSLALQMRSWADAET